MCGVTANEGAPVPKATSHQAAADPILLAEDIVAKPVIDAENGTKCPITINALEVDLVRREMVVDQPVVLAIDRDRGTATTRIVRHGHPRWLLDEHIL